MTIASSATNSNDERKRAQAILIALLEEIYRVEIILEPFADAEAALLKSETAEQKKRLEAADDTLLSALKLRALKNDIDKIEQRAKAFAARSSAVTRSRLLEEIYRLERSLERVEGTKATALRAEAKNIKDNLPSLNDSQLSSLRKKIENLATQTLLLREIDDIEQTLELLKGHEAASLKSETEDRRKILSSFTGDDLSTLRKEINTLTIKSFLLKEIDEIETILKPLKGDEAASLKSEIEDKKKSLKSLDDSRLASARREIGMLKEKAQSLVSKPGWESIAPAPIWLAVGLALIPLLIALYSSILAILQWHYQPQIRFFASQTAEIMLTTPPPTTETPTPTSP